MAKMVGMGVLLGAAAAAYVVVLGALAYVASHLWAPLAFLVVGTGVGGAIGALAYYVERTG